MVSLKHVWKNVSATVISVCSKRNICHSGFVAQAVFSQSRFFKKVILNLLGTGYVPSTTASFSKVTGSSYCQADFWTSDLVHHHSFCKKESSSKLKMKIFTHLLLYSNAILIVIDYHIPRFVLYS